MCGLTGVFDLKKENRIDASVVARMAAAIVHRGPDESSQFIEENIGIGFNRLSIVDVQDGHQPFFNGDGNIVLFCNGEIYNHKEIRERLEKKGYKFKTRCDVEVIVHLYEDCGVDLFNQLNGQFAFILYDKRNNQVLLARDHFGICPLFFSVVSGLLLFASEIKAILTHPMIERKVNLTGLDQIITFPGLLSPSSMFDGIHSLKPGHFMLVRDGQYKIHEYWDLDFPIETGDTPPHDDYYYIEQFEYLLRRSVSMRLNADVPVGFYLSGGIDSSIVGALMNRARQGTQFDSFSISFPDEDHREHNENFFQRLLSGHLSTAHHEIEFRSDDAERLLRRAVYFSECPLKETYNTCSLMLSEAAKTQNIKVILSGEGSDELLGGYVGYRMDEASRLAYETDDINTLLERDYRFQAWGDEGFFYEQNFTDLRELKKDLYSDSIYAGFAGFDALRKMELNKERLVGRHVFNKRSYLDMKLRLADHLISDHCDRVTYANSVEGRYPFLDIDLVEFIKSVPPSVKLRNGVEKSLLKEMCKKYIPHEIIARNKFSFVAHDSSKLLRRNVEWINDLLSTETIKRQGYFQPQMVERLRHAYSKPGFKLNAPYETDLLIIIVTFGIFLDTFKMPNS
jgi:asparagine synthase (glutamine-hydrolysing)